MRTQFSVTYETITPESAADGESADDGYVCEDVSLREAIGELHGASVEPSCYPFDANYPYTWFTTIDA